MSYYTSIELEDLKNAIGAEFSYNFSRTLRARLLEVHKGYCIYEEIVSPYKSCKEEPREGTFKAPISLMWNSLFY